MVKRGGLIVMRELQALRQIIDELESKKKSKQV